MKGFSSLDVRRDICDVLTHISIWTKSTGPSFLSGLKSFPYDRLSNKLKNKFLINFPTKCIVFRQVFVVQTEKQK